MIRIHSQFEYQGVIRLGGRLNPGQVVYHLISDRRTPEERKGELRLFVLENKLPMSLLRNPHARKKKPHLDVWGHTADLAYEALENKEIMFGRRRVDKC